MTLADDRAVGDRVPECDDDALPRQLGDELEGALHLRRRHPEVDGAFGRDLRVVGRSPDRRPQVIDRVRAARPRVGGEERPPSRCTPVNARATTGEASPAAYWTQVGQVSR